MNKRQRKKAARKIEQPQRPKYHYARIMLAMPDLAAEAPGAFGRYIEKEIEFSKKIADIIRLGG